MKRVLIVVLALIGFTWAGESTINGFWDGPKAAYAQNYDDGGGGGCYPYQAGDTWQGPDGTYYTCGHFCGGWYSPEPYVCSYTYPLIWKP